MAQTMESGQYSFFSLFFILFILLFDTTMRIKNNNIGKPKSNVLMNVYILIFCLSVIVFLISLKLSYNLIENNTLYQLKFNIIVIVIIIGSLIFTVGRLKFFKDNKKNILIRQMHSYTNILFIFYLLFIFYSDIFGYKFKRDMHEEHFQHYRTIYGRDYFFHRYILGNKSTKFYHRTIKKSVIKGLSDTGELEEREYYEHIQREYIPILFYNGSQLDILDVEAARKRMKDAKLAKALQSQKKKQQKEEKKQKYKDWFTNIRNTLTIDPDLKIKEKFSKLKPTWTFDDFKNKFKHIFESLKNDKTSKKEVAEQLMVIDSLIESNPSPGFRDKMRAYINGILEERNRKIKEQNEVKEAKDRIRGKFKEVKDLRSSMQTAYEQVKEQTQKQ